MAAIGILGGMGPQASAKLYELLISGTKAYTPAAVDADFPEIVLLNVPVPDFISNKTCLPEAKQTLIERAQLLEYAGCTINGIACNTAHLLLPELQTATKVPFLSLPELVANRVKASDFRRVGLLATPTTLASSLYDDTLDPASVLVRPDAELAARVERYIYRQLSSSLTDQERQTFRGLVNNFMERERLDAVIFGCTELPLVYGDSSKDTRILDTLEILANALLAEYFDGARRIAT